jgi:hypothetical protein
MEMRNGVDGQTRPHAPSASQVHQTPGGPFAAPQSESRVRASAGPYQVIEWKCPPGGPVRLPWLSLAWLAPLRSRWLQVAPLALLLFVGAWVPGFLVTLAFLLVGLVVALGAFILFVQLPLGYLVRYWRGKREGSSPAPSPRNRAPSSGI